MMLPMELYVPVTIHNTPRTNTVQFRTRPVIGSMPCGRQTTFW